MLLQQQQSQFIIIDVQEKLMPLISGHDKLLQNQLWLTALANELEIPVCVSEHYPKGLGATIASLQQLAQKNPAYCCFDKTDFSCAGVPACQAMLKLQQKKQIVLIGIEAHVCVLQSAMEFHDQGYSVFVVADAIGSRAVSDQEYAISRMMQRGIHVVSREMVFFEWLKSASHPRFKELAKKFMQ